MGPDIWSDTTNEWETRGMFLGYVNRRDFPPIRPWHVAPIHWRTSRRSHISLDDSWTRGQLMIPEKVQLQTRPGQWQQPMKFRTRKISSMSKTGRTRLEIISSWADNAQPTLLFWHEHYTPVLELTKLMWTIVNDG